jgi:ATP-dependent helicase HrpB
LARAFADRLPIDTILPQIEAALTEARNLVIVAPPGAGKTTRVPLAFLDAQWSRGQKIILLEPRRLAARAAARRMASTLNETLGETVGVRMRLESRISARTRIEVVTEGVFARMILDNPALEGVAAVLFDEFHERSLDADFGLALALDAQGGLREDLRLVAMSATLDGARVSRLMGDAQVIESEGRAFPVETRYLGRDASMRIEDGVTRVVMRALAEERGSILVFLPGQAEIARVAAQLAERRPGADVDIAPLYGGLDRAEQDLAVLPARAGRRKIVLATSIAETSLTIEGVSVVIDSGLSRAPIFEPDLGLTRLETKRSSRASVDQRRGRAGRTEPGVCYRLWDEPATSSLPDFDAPEILSADLTGLALDLAFWGVADPRSLSWLDPPPPIAWKEAVALLRSLDALDEAGWLTPHGRAMRALPLAPRLSRMILDGAGRDEAERAADLAMLMSERGLGGAGVDLSERLERFRAESSKRAKDARRLSASWARIARASVTTKTPTALSDGALIALAFPDRVAKSRGARGEFLMANGRAAALAPEEPLARENYLAIGEIMGRAAQARILAAAPIALEEIESLFGSQFETRDETIFDAATASLRRRSARRLGAVKLSERNLPVEGDQESAEILARGIAALGVGRLPWTKAQMQKRDRIAFLRRVEGEEDWPDVSDAALAANAAEWLAHYIVGRTSLSSITSEDLDAVLAALLPYELSRRLDSEAPPYFETPAGSRIAVDYATESGPLLSVRVQELYGLSQHPALAKGRAPLTLELLSPAHRPIQTTRDLPGFWAGSWSEVKKEMKGRYPRHVWPDDPAHAAPTTRAKPRS